MKRARVEINFPSAAAISITQRRIQVFDWIFLDTLMIYCRLRPQSLSYLLLIAIDEHGPRKASTMPKTLRRKARPVRFEREKSSILLLLCVSIMMRCWPHGKEKSPRVLCLGAIVTFLCCLQKHAAAAAHTNRNLLQPLSTLLTPSKRLSFVT